MAGKRYTCKYIALVLFLVVHSCVQRATAPEERADTVAVDSLQSPLLWTDEELAAEENNREISEELFDDFLYNYMQDTLMQRQRAVFPLPERQNDGSTLQISESDWSDDYHFVPADYTTVLYNSEAEMSIKEDTALWRASVEKIDLRQETIVAYDFMRHNRRWNLVAIRNMRFADCDLKDFLQFYSRFATTPARRESSLARSIRVSVVNPDPEEESQNIEGFITREQWPTMGVEVPEGIIMNKRYGQQYQHSKHILMEKASVGDGLSELFTFVKGVRGWELVGYEN